MAAAYDCDSYSRFLFLDSDGRPFHFYMPPCEERTRLKPLIEYGGGTINSKIEKDCLKLAVPGQKIKGSDLVNSKYILDCVAQNKVLDHNDYRMFPNTVAERPDESFSDLEPADNIVRISPTKHGRSKYNKSEDTSIVRYLLDERLYRETSGNSVWKSMELFKVTGHSWQSMKDRFKKYIIPNIDSYLLSKREVALLTGRKIKPDSDEEPGIINLDSDDDIPPRKKPKIDSIEIVAYSKDSAIVKKEIFDLDDFDRELVEKAKRPRQRKLSVSHLGEGENVGSSRNRENLDVGKTNSPKKADHKQLSPSKEDSHSRKRITPRKKPNRISSDETDTPEEEETNIKSSKNITENSHDKGKGKGKNRNTGVSKNMDKSTSDDDESEGIGNKNESSNDRRSSGGAQLRVTVAKFTLDEGHSESIRNVNDSNNIKRNSRRARQRLKDAYSDSDGSPSDSSKVDKEVEERRSEEVVSAEAERKLREIEEENLSKSEDEEGVDVSPSVIDPDHANRKRESHQKESTQTQTRRKLRMDQLAHRGRGSRTAASPQKGVSSSMRALNAPLKNFIFHQDLSQPVFDVIDADEEELESIPGKRRKRHGLQEAKDLMKRLRLWLDVTDEELLATLWMTSGSVQEAVTWILRGGKDTSLVWHAADDEDLLSLVTEKLAMLKKKFGPAGVERRRQFLADSLS